jgi:hypothetical protein
MIMSPDLRCSPRRTRCPRVENVEPGPSVTLSLFRKPRTFKLARSRSRQRAIFRCLNLMSASGVVKCHLASVWWALRSCSQAAISSMSVCRECSGRGTIERRIRILPNRANCRVLECSFLRSVRPTAWLRRQGRLRRVKPCGDVEMVLDQNDLLGRSEHGPSRFHRERHARFGKELR